VESEYFQCHGLPVPGSRAGLDFLKDAVVKRSYVRTIFRLVYLMQSHSFSSRKSLIIRSKVCETLVSIEGVELAPNQIPLSALWALNRESHLDGSFF